MSNVKRTSRVGTNNNSAYTWTPNTPDTTDSITDSVTLAHAIDPLLETSTDKPNQQNALSKIWVN